MVASQLVEHYLLVSSVSQQNAPLMISKAETNQVSAFSFHVLLILRNWDTSTDRDALRVRAATTTFDFIFFGWGSDTGGHNLHFRLDCINKKKLI